MSNIMGILREVSLHFIRQCFPSLFNTLRVSLGRGHVDSTDVTLSKSDPISVCGIPWQVVDGKISGLSLQLPWMNRLSAKFSVKVNSAHIHLSEVVFPDLQEAVFKAINDELRREKFRVVAEAERGQAPFGSSVRRIVSQVLERIELEVEDFVASVEFADGFTGTFTVSKILASRPEPASHQESRTLLVSIEGISANIKSASGDLPVPLDIPDFSISLGIQLEEDTLKLDLEVSKTVEVCIHSSLREFLHSLKLRRAQWWSAHKWGRPISRLRADGVLWMRYAYRRITAAHGLLRVCFDFESLRHALRNCIDYKNLHVKRLNKSRLKPEEVSRITELEESFDSGLILLLRHAAQRDFAADEVSQFGRSEWLRWILFGHQMSSERERLTADVRRSLEESTGHENTTDLGQEEGGHVHGHGEEYSFKCRFHGVSVRASSGSHELEITLTGLGFNARVKSTMVHFDVGLVFEDALFSIDGDAFGRRQPLPEGGPIADHRTPQLTAVLSQSPDGVSSSVHLQSISVVLHPRIIESCSSVFQHWTLPLLPRVFDREEYHARSYRREGQSRGLSNLNTSSVFGVENMYLLLFDDRVIYRGKSPALFVSLRQIAVRSLQSSASFRPEVNGSLSLQGIEFDAHSKPANFSVPGVVPGARESSLGGDRQQFVSFSTQFQLGWNPTASVKLDNVVGFIHVPTSVGLMNRLRGLRKSTTVEALSSECDENDVQSTPAAVFDAPDIQERFVQSGLQIIVSFLRISILWDSQALDHVLLLEIERWETKLSSPEYLLESMRIGGIRLCSPSARPFTFSIEPTSELEYGIRLKRGSRPQMCGYLFEVLIGNISSQLCEDVVIAMATLITDTVETSRSSSQTVHLDSSSEADGGQAMTLLSILASSLKIRWSDGTFGAEISCSDLQVAAEGNEVSGSAEMVSLTKLDADHDESSPGQEIILRVTNPLRSMNSVVRFLCEPRGYDINLHNLTASMKRSFWEPLVLSIGDVLEALEARYSHERVSTFHALGDDNRGMPINIEGSGIILNFPMSNPDSPRVHADVSQVIVLWQSGLQRFSFRRTSVVINKVDTKSQGLWRTRSGTGTPLLQTAGFDIEHNFASLQDSGTSVHYSDTWELTTSNAVAIALSPSSLLTLRASLADFLSPYNSTERINSAHNETGKRVDTPSNSAERTRVLFRGSIKSLRLNLGTDGEGVNSEPFAAIEAQEICLSSAEVRNGVGTDICDLAVLSWLATCSVVHLMKCQPNSPEHWRIVVGHDVRRYVPSFPSHSRKGVSVRFVSRQDHGLDTRTFGIRMNDVSIMHDPDLYVKLSEFTTDYSRRSNTVDQEKILETTECQIGAHNRHHHIAMESESARKPEISCSNLSSGDQRMASKYVSSSKVDVSVANFTLLCSFGEDCGSVYCGRLHIRTACMDLVMSRLMHPLNGSAVRVEGISFRVDTIHSGTARFVDSVTEGQPLGHRMSGTGETFDESLYSMHLPSAKPTSAGLRQGECGAEKLITTVSNLSLKLKRSHDGELVLSIGSVAVDTSIDTLLRLGEVISRYVLSFSVGSSAISLNSFATPSELQLHIHSVTLRLTLDHSSNNHWDESAPCIGSMTVDLSVALSSVTDIRSQISQGVVRLSLEVSDNSSGHRDALVSPCHLRYQIKKERECAIEAEIRQLLRIAFSPVSMKMISALLVALESWDLFACTPGAQQAIVDTGSRFIICIHGIAVRCLADVPRIQVLRLLLGEVRFDGTFSITSRARLMGFSIREFLLEDTMSWRLFRRDSKDSSSRRWERIIASVRRHDDGSEPFSPGSLQDLQISDVRLCTARYPQDSAESCTSPALQGHVTWSSYFENFKARICSSGVDFNLDMVALPVIHEWYRTVIRELPSGDGSRLHCQDGLLDEPQQTLQRASWFSELNVEAVSITGSIRAAPRRIQESLYQRLLTYFLNVDSVTGLAFHLPAIRIQGKQSMTNLLHQVVLSYSRSSISVEFLWQILMQTRKLLGVLRLFTLSRFRQRPYNPLRVATQNKETLGENQMSVGLSVALEDDNMPSRDVEARTAPLVVQRIARSGGSVITRMYLQPSSVDVVDLT